MLSNAELLRSVEVVPKRRAIAPRGRLLEVADSDLTADRRCPPFDGHACCKMRGMLPSRPLLCALLVTSCLACSNVTTIGAPPRLPGAVGLVVDALWATTSHFGEEDEEQKAADARRRAEQREMENRQIEEVIHCADREVARAQFVLDSTSIAPPDSELDAGDEPAGSPEERAEDARCARVLSS